MKGKISTHTFLIVFCLGCAALGLLIALAGRAEATSGDPEPYPPPPTPMATLTQAPPAPTTTPAPPQEPSPAAKAARAYIAQREGIPEASLDIVADHETIYPNLERNFQVVTLVDRNLDGNIYKLLVDLSSGEMIEDISSLLEQEESAKRQKYGKLQPSLYERLQKAGADEVVTVTLWVVEGPGKSLADREAAAFAALVKKYPEARAAVERGGKPMDVDDPALAEQIYKEYVELVESGVTPLLQPLLDELDKRGIAYRLSPGMPAVTVSLTKEIILLLAQRSDVGAIFLAEGGKLLNQLDTSVPTNRAPLVWKRGYDGTGIRIAFLEVDGIVDFTSPTGSGECRNGDNCFLHPGDVLGTGEDDHASLVASAAASNHPTYRGMAAGATVLSAKLPGSDRQDGIDALVWALDHSVDIVNASFGLCTGSAMMDVIDYAFDHYARARYRLIVPAAGNNNWLCPYDDVVSPAKGWNVLSVGAYNDQGTIYWPGDAMADFSDWDNPDSPHHDHEKPEVVAPGVGIKGIALNGNFWEADGTSVSAPQVAGLGALLIHRNSDLRPWPEASRAILMASAVHNIEGSTIIPGGEDLRDGAGGIDAALADTIAQTHSASQTTPCSGPCWWGFSINNSSFPVGQYFETRFRACKGERVRVAIAWWSNTNCPSEYNCSFDRLDTDLDLRIKDPDGYWVYEAVSASFDNNYELVEFKAPLTGTYRISVQKARGDEYANFLGIAWTKMATYLPDINTSSGWETKIVVRNDGSQPKDVDITLFDTAGDWVSMIGYSPLAPNAIWSLNVLEYLPGFLGSAIVDASEDVSVVVEKHQSSPDVWAAYTGVSQPSTAVYVPILHKANYGWTSTIYLRNTATTQASVTIAFKAVVGNSCTPAAYNIPGNGLLLLNLGSVSCVGSPFVGSAYITSNQPLAVASAQNHYNASGQVDALMESEMAGNAAAAVYAPLIQNYNWISGLSLQNASASTNNLSVTFYNSDPYNGTECDPPPDIYNNVQARFSVFDSYPPGNPLCTPVISAILSGGALPVAGIINQSKQGTNQWTDYPAIASPGQMVVIPVWYRDSSFTTGIVVMNVSGSQQVKITVRFFASTGGNEIEAHRKVETLNPHQIYILNAYPAGTFVGSVVVTATRPVAVAVNHVKSGATSDGIMSHSGVHR